MWELWNPVMGHMCTPLKVTVPIHVVEGATPWDIMRFMGMGRTLYRKNWRLTGELVASYALITVPLCLGELIQSIHCPYFRHTLYLRIFLHRLSHSEGRIHGRNQILEELMDCMDF